MLRVTPGQLCRYRVGGGGLCVVLTVSYEKKIWLIFMTLLWQLYNNTGLVKKGFRTQKQKKLSASAIAHRLLFIGIMFL